MASYTTVDEVEKRLTEGGVLWVADNDRDGTKDDDTTIERAIRFADNHVDQAVMRRIDPTAARSQQLDFLKDLATDIAAWRASGDGGRDIPEPLKQAAELAFATLRGVKSDNDPIPGLVIPAPNNSSLGRVTRTPMVFNPKD